jgi:hypothetical protein
MHFIPGLTQSSVRQLSSSSEWQQILTHPGAMYHFYEALTIISPYNNSGLNPSPIGPKTQHVCGKFSQLIPINSYKVKSKYVVAVWLNINQTMNYHWSRTL